ncbi:MAG: glycoside hydrolase domain-containing protein, partial [Gemmatimonadales bacterium]
MKPSLLAASLFLLLPSVLPAQSVPYGVGQWNPDSLGNHRAVVQVDAPADAVRLHIPWRRRDRHPGTKRIIVTDSAGRRVTNAIPVSVTRESGDIV